jgi:hypothetical protein
MSRTCCAPEIQLVQSSRNDVEGAVQVLRLDTTNSEAFVIALKELRQKGAAGLHVADAGQAQFLDQAVLQRPVHSFDAAGKRQSFGISSARIFGDSWAQPRLSGLTAVQVQSVRGIPQSVCPSCDFKQGVQSFSTKGGKVESFNGADHRSLAVSSAAEELDLLWSKPPCPDQPAWIRMSSDRNTSSTPFLLYLSGPWYQKPA